ncbi:unnamed protein product [Linum trigynum]|uniref:Uncharacterized protein n=1 Tax=Linum trigynum TaxID=586398 RepID=A0AAV2CWB6_9ROSI
MSIFVMFRANVKSVMCLEMIAQILVEEQEDLGCEEDSSEGSNPYFSVEQGEKCACVQDVDVTRYEVSLEAGMSCVEVSDAVVDEAELSSTPEKEFEYVQKMSECSKVDEDDGFHVVKK